MIDTLKELGNREFRRGAYQPASKFYTEALDSVNDTTPIETQRSLLANRAQAFFYRGLILEALRDVNHALAPKYTTQDSPKPLTAKCRYRRARLLCTMARYDQAQKDYAEFANLLRELGTEISGEELSLKDDLDSRVAAGENSEQRRRDELMRAVDAQGIMLWRGYRDNFPLPPQNMQEPLGPNFDPESMTISFDTTDSRPDHNLPDPSLTPMSIPVTIRAPFFHYPNPDDLTVFSTRPERPVSPGETIGTFTDGLFMDAATSSHVPVEKKAQIIAMASTHERAGVVFTVTSCGRVYKIPRNTTMKDVVAGARWPRQYDAPVFEDLRRAPRQRTDDIDGVKLAMGWTIEMFIIPEDQLAAFVGLLESGFTSAGM